MLEFLKFIYFILLKKDSVFKDASLFTIICGGFYVPEADTEPKKQGKTKELKSIDFQA